MQKTAHNLYSKANIHIALSTKCTPNQFQIVANNPVLNTTRNIELSLNNFGQPHLPGMLFLGSNIPMAQSLAKKPTFENPWSLQYLNPQNSNTAVSEPTTNEFSVQNWRLGNISDAAIVEIHAISLLKRRRKKMNKHKWKKHRKALNKSTRYNKETLRKRGALRQIQQ